MTAQLLLFTSQPNEIKHDHQGISGLTYYPGLLSKAEQLAILREVDSRPWQHDWKRRVQHYGYKYDYKARRINESMYVGALPLFAVELGGQLVTRGLFREQPDQLIVNEYLPGQGI